MTDKAKWLLAEQRVVPTGRAMTFTVHGENDRYTTFVRDDKSTWCSCPAFGVCSHRLAAAALALALRDQGLDGIALDDAA